MVLYTNYTQKAKVVLRSSNAIVSTKQFVIDTLNVDVVQHYAFMITVPNVKFNKETRVAVESFVIHNTNEVINYDQADIGDVYLTSINKKNVVATDNIQGTHLLSFSGLNYSYNNTDLVLNSFSVSGQTQFLEGQGIDILVNTKLEADNGEDIRGCPRDVVWGLTLIVYEMEKQENEKDFVDDRAKNYSQPALY